MIGLRLPRSFGLVGAGPADRRIDVLAAAASPRFRAATRPRLRSSARQTVGIIVLAAAMNLAWLLPNHPGQAPRIAIANLAIVAMAVLLLALLRRRHARVEALVFGVLVAVDAVIAAVVGIDNEVALMCGGYLLLTPPIVSLLVPWRTRVHLAWIVVHVAMSVLTAQLAPPEMHEIGGPRVLLGLLVVSTAVSVVGHLANLTARVTSFLHIAQIRSLNREARRSDGRLRGLNAALETMTRTDPLTGLGNRVALWRELELARRRIDRYGARYALLELDLDHFKGINDQRGHLAGDDVLRRVAAAIQDSLRAGDLAFRYGGEEFLVLARLSRPRDALAAAERIREAVEALAIDHPSNPPFGVVTVSIGVRVIGPGDLDASNDGWLGVADGALYAAKRLGRNRTATAGPIIGELVATRHPRQSSSAQLA